MRKVTVNRPQKVQFPFTKGKVLIDGVERETVKAGKSAAFEVPDGSHRIQVVFGSLPPTESNLLQIEASDGDTSFEVKIKVPLSSSDSTTAELTKI
jgi:hypothetical protein